jgi:hypothetical protein
VQDTMIVDIAMNLSDHRPFINTFALNNVPNLRDAQPSSSVKGASARYVWRWDKTNILDYNEGRRGF